MRACGLRAPQCTEYRVPYKFIISLSPTTKAAAPSATLWSVNLVEETSSKWQEGTKSSGRTVSVAASTTAACVSTDKSFFFFFLVHGVSRVAASYVALSDNAPANL